MLGWQSGGARRSGEQGAGHPARQAWCAMRCWPALAGNCRYRMTQWFDRMRAGRSCRRAKEPGHPAEEPVYPAETLRSAETRPCSSANSVAPALVDTPTLL